MSICGKRFTKYTNIIYGVLIAALLPLFPFFEVKAENSSVRILAYHTFMGDKNVYSFSLDEFKKQYEELRSEGFTFISFADFKNRNFKGDKNILLTIDDGHRTVYDAYKQVMRPLGIKPVLAIYPGIIGKKKFALTWEQLKEMRDDGCAFASHGFYHNFCNEKAIKKDFKAVETEIIKSKAVLEEKLGVKIDTFMYPFGLHSPQTEAMLKKAGYSYAMNIKVGAAKIGANYDYRLPRYLMTRNRITRISKLFVEHKKINSAEIKNHGDKFADDAKIKKTYAKIEVKSENEISEDIAEPQNLFLSKHKDRETGIHLAAVFGGNHSGVPMLSENTKVTSIKNRIYSFMGILYDVNVKFFNEIYAEATKINLKIHGFFLNLFAK